MLMLYGNIKKIQPEYIDSLQLTTRFERISLNFHVLTQAGNWYVGKKTQRK